MKQCHRACQWKPLKSLTCPEPGTVLTAWKNLLAWRSAKDARKELTVQWTARKMTGRLQVGVRVTRTGARSAAVKRTSTGRLRKYLANVSVWLHSNTFQHWPEFLWIGFTAGKKPKMIQGSQVLIYFSTNYFFSDCFVWKWEVVRY